MLFLLRLYVGTEQTKKYLDIEYGFSNKLPVTVTIGKTICNLNFVCLDKYHTYYFFEDKESKELFIKRRGLYPDYKILVEDPSFHSKEDKRETKFVIKMKLIDANHCPGSCMFMFWIYRVGKIQVFKPELYIYTGDYCLNETLEKQLMSYRYSETVKKVTIVYDNTRIGEVDYAMKSDDEAISKMKDFIEFHRKRHNGPITVKIGADWGMEDLWIRLVKEYQAKLFVDESWYRKICSIYGESYKNNIKISSKGKSTPLKLRYSLLLCGQ